MSTVNRARVFAMVPSRKAPFVARKLDKLRLPVRLCLKNGDGLTQVGFDVPRDMTTQSAILLFDSLLPEGTEIYAS